MTMHFIEDARRLMRYETLLWLKKDTERDKDKLDAALLKGAKPSLGHRALSDRSAKPSLHEGAALSHPLLLKAAVGSKASDMPCCALVQRQFCTPQMCCTHTLFNVIM